MARGGRRGTKNILGKTKRNDPVHRRRRNRTRPRQPGPSRPAAATHPRASFSAFYSFRRRRLLLVRSERRGRRPRGRRDPVRLRRAEQGASPRRNVNFIGSFRGSCSTTRRRPQYTYSHPPCARRGAAATPRRSRSVSSRLWRRVPSRPPPLPCRRVPSRPQPPRASWVLAVLPGNA